MRKLTILLFTCLTVFNLACRPDKCCVPPHSNIYLSALKNGEQWYASPDNSNIKGDTVTVDGNYSSPALQEHLAIKIKYASYGKYILTGSQVVYNFSRGMQAALHNLQLDNTYENYMVINSYDAGTGIMSGTFSVRLINTPADPNASAGPVSFLNGQFEVRLQK